MWLTTLNKMLQINHEAAGYIEFTKERIEEIKETDKAVAGKLKDGVTHKEADLEVNKKYEGFLEGKYESCES